MPDPPQPRCHVERRGNSWVIVEADGKKLAGSGAYKSEAEAQAAVKTINKSWKQAKYERKSKGAPEITEADARIKLRIEAVERDPALREALTVGQVRGGAGGVVRALDRAQRSKMGRLGVTDTGGHGYGGTAWKWNPKLHPRDRIGRFREVLGAMSRMWGDIVRLPGGVRVEKGLAGYVVHTPSGKKRVATAGAAAKLALGKLTEADTKAEVENYSYPPRRKKKKKKKKPEAEAALKEAVEARKAAAAAGDALTFTSARVREQALREQLVLQERRREFGYHFDPRLHPRDRLGQFVDVLTMLKSKRGTDVKLPHGVSVKRKPGRYEVNVGGTRIGRHRAPAQAAGKALDVFDRLEGPHPYTATEPSPIIGVTQTRRVRTQRPDLVRIGAGKDEPLPYETPVEFSLAKGGPTRRGVVIGHGAAGLHYVRLPGGKETHGVHRSNLVPVGDTEGMGAGKNGSFYLEQPGVGTPGVGERAWVLPEQEGGVRRRGIVRSVKDGQHEIEGVGGGSFTVPSERVLHPLSRAEGGMGAGKDGEPWEMFAGGNTNYGSLKPGDKFRFPQSEVVHIKTAKGYIDGSLGREFIGYYWNGNLLIGAKTGVVVLPRLGERGPGAGKEEHPDLIRVRGRDVQPGDVVRMDTTPTTMFGQDVYSTLGIERVVGPRKGYHGNIEFNVVGSYYGATAEWSEEARSHGLEMDREYEVIRSPKPGSPEWVEFRRSIGIVDDEKAVKAAQRRSGWKPEGAGAGKITDMQRRDYLALAPAQRAVYLKIRQMPGMDHDSAVRYAAERGGTFKEGDEVSHRSDPHRRRGHIVQQDPDDPDTFIVQWYPQDTEMEWVKRQDLASGARSGEAPATKPTMGTVGDVLAHKRRRSRLRP